MLMALLAACFLPISYLACFSTLKMEAALSMKRPWIYIGLLPEEIIIHSVKEIGSV
jgi:hypothetical protein